MACGHACACVLLGVGGCVWLFREWRCRLLGWRGGRGGCGVGGAGLFAYMKEPEKVTVCVGRVFGCVSMGDDDLACVVGGWVCVVCFEWRDSVRMCLCVVVVRGFVWRQSICRRFVDTVA